MQQYQPPPRQQSQLAPDSKGQTIPLDATWTKIDRKLVSPEVLERAGVRYEARPNFVAVLGILSREQIEDYARKSFEVRNARSSPAARVVDAERRARQETYGDHYRKRGGGGVGGSGDRGLARDGADALFDASESDDDNSRHRGAPRARDRNRYTPQACRHLLMAAA
jgi:hypothetical protein